MVNLTTRQRAIYEFIVRQIRTDGIPPTLMEIASAFGLSSPAGVSDHLKAIERKGYIRRRPGASRGIEVSIRRRRDGGRQSVRVPVLGSVPSSRGLRGRAVRHLVVDGRLSGGDLFALRAATPTLVARGILEGDLLVVERGESHAGDLVVGSQGRRVVLLELSGNGSQARPLVGRLADTGDVTLEGRVIAVLRTFEATTD